MQELIEETPIDEQVRPPLPWKRWTLFLLLPIALIIGAYGYATGGRVMTTDNAYVEADKVGLSTDVSGVVQTIKWPKTKESKPVRSCFDLTNFRFA